MSNQSEHINELASALSKCQGEITPAIKDSKNPFFKSKYADLNAVLEACVPHFNDNGITVLQPTIVSEGKNYVETILMHESGEFISSLTEIKVSKQNDAQAEGSGISYARRYGLQSFANLAAVDDDGEKSIGRESKAVEAPKSSVVEQMKAAQTKPAQAKAPAVAEKKTTKFAPAKKVEVSDDLDL
jgi:hypothetical protein